MARHLPLWASPSAVRWCLIDRQTSSEQLSDVVIVVGPRQAGKSTLASVVADERGARYVTLDDDGPREAANEDPTGFVEGATLPLCVDEFQKAPALLPAIKARVDRARAGGERPAGMFMLTGSANVWATLRISESLVGRAERVPLWPLSQGELLGRRETFIDDLFAGRVAQFANAPVGRSAIAEALTTGGYPEALARRKAGRRGRWFEEYIAMTLHHLRTAGGREVDILLERGDGSVCGIEVKLGAAAHSRDFAALRHLQSKLGPRLKLGVVVHTGSETLPFGQGLWALPVSALWTPASEKVAG